MTKTNALIAFYGNLIMSELSKAVIFQWAYLVAAVICMIGFIYIESERNDG